MPPTAAALSPTARLPHLAFTRAPIAVTAARPSGAPTQDDLDRINALARSPLAASAVYVFPAEISNRQATKDRLRDDTEANEVDMLVDLLKQNTQLTEQVERLTRAVHEHITRETGETREAHEPAAARGLTAAQTITQAPTLPAGVRKRQRTRGTKEPPHD